MDKDCLKGTAGTTLKIWPIISGPVDSSVDKLRAHLLKFLDSSLGVELHRIASDEVEADESDSDLHTELRQARDAGQALRTFMPDNQRLEAG
jgi:hypothetical protein